MNKIKYIFIVLLLVVIGGYIFLMISLMNKEEEKNHETNDNPSEIIENVKYQLIIGDDINSSIWELNGINWNSINKVDDKKLYNVIINNNYYGKYYLKFIQRWNLFDSANRFREYEGSFLAYSEDLKIDLKPYDIQDISYEDIVEINNSLGISANYSDLTVKEKVVIDLDNNGIEDIIVNVSNVEYDNEVDKDQYFTLLYVILNGKKYELSKSIYNGDEKYIVSFYGINYIMNIGDSGYNNIIVRQKSFSTGNENGNEMYGFQDGDYKLLIKD